MIHNDELFKGSPVTDVIIPLSKKFRTTSNAKAFSEQPTAPILGQGTRSTKPGNSGGKSVPRGKLPPKGVTCNGEGVICNGFWGLGRRRGDMSHVTESVGISVGVVG